MREKSFTESSIAGLMRWAGGPEIGGSNPLSPTKLKGLVSDSTSRDSERGPEIGGSNPLALTKQKGAGSPRP